MTTERRIVALETAVKATNLVHKLRDDLADRDLAILYLSYGQNAYQSGDPGEAQEAHAWMWAVLVDAFGPEAYVPLGFEQPPTFSQLVAMRQETLQAHCRRLSHLAAGSCDR